MEREGREDREERFAWVEGDRGEEVVSAILIVVALIEILRRNESS